MKKPPISPLEKKGHLWTLVCEAANPHIRDIPGLYINEEANIVSGGPDAVAAACAILGVKTSPPLPDWKQMVPWAGAALHTLRVYQQQGVKALEQVLGEHGGALLGDEMGLGKTRQAIITANSMANQSRKFILSPAGVRETWQAELLKLGVAQKDICILGPKASYAKDWKRAGTCEWVIGGYGALLDKAFKAGFSTETPGFLILDEAHLLRGRDSARSKTLVEIAPLIPYRLGLTGSVLYDRPRDIYKPMHILLGNRFGTKYGFDYRYCAGQLNEHGGLDNQGVSNAQELALRLNYYKVARTKKEVGDQMPKLTRTIQWMDPAPVATAAFKRALVQRGKGMTQAALEATLEGKIPEAIRLAQEAPRGRFLLITWMKKHAEKLHQELLKLDVPCVVITGDVGQKARTVAIKHAAAKGMGVVATMDSVGTGVDGLQHVASTGIMHAVSYLPKLMSQVEARLDRIGQEEPVSWTYLAMRESMDALVVNKVIIKMDNQQAVEGRDSASLRDSFTEVDESQSLKALYEEMT